jgi:hypothetical protein
VGRCPFFRKEEVMHPRIVAERTMIAQLDAVNSASKLAKILGMGDDQVDKLQVSMNTNRAELKVLRMSEATADFLKAVVEALDEPEGVERSSFLDFLSDDVRTEIFKKWDSPDALRTATIEELTEIKGVGPAKAGKIIESVAEAFGGSDNE